MREVSTIEANHLAEQGDVERVLSPSQECIIGAVQQRVHELALNERELRVDVDDRDVLLDNALVERRLRSSLHGENS